MTDQLRACAVCFRQWVSQPGEVKCAACSPGRAIPVKQANALASSSATVTKRPYAKRGLVSRDLSQESGPNGPDFCERRLDLSKVPDEPTLADLDAYLAGSYDQ